MNTESEPGLGPDDSTTPEQPERRSVQSREAHLIGADALARLMPHAHRMDVDTVRLDFARWLTSAEGRRPRADWQEAMNAWTGATPYRPGHLRVHPPRCHDCSHGVARRPSMRSMSRGLNPMICGTCGGTGRGQMQTITVLFAR